MDWKDVRDYKDMMQCSVRMDAYRDAIAATCGGKVVLEIGVGLGPLSLMALKAGAKRVYGIELDAGALEAARTIIAANGFGPDRFVPLRGLSTHVQLPERVDVVLSETLDSMGVGENTALYMRDALERFLKPDGLFVPASLDCVAALARPQVWEDERRFWTDRLQSGWDLDYRAMVPIILPNNRVVEVRSDELRSRWAVWQRIDFQRPETFRTRSEALMLVEKPGEITGIARAFVAKLGGGVTLSTLSQAPLTCWKQYFAPFPRPIEAQAGDAVHAVFDVSEPDQPGLGVTTTTTHVPRAALPGFVAALKARMTTVR
jgi:protein arginine N-methyltransferase 1